MKKNNAIAITVIFGVLSLFKIIEPNFGFALEGGGEALGYNSVTILFYGMFAFGIYKWATIKEVKQ